MPIFSLQVLMPNSDLLPVSVLFWGGICLDVLLKVTDIVDVIWLPTQKTTTKVNILHWMQTKTET